MSVSTIQQEPTHGYLIPVGEADRERLKALGRIFNGTSVSFLNGREVKKGARILDVGCGGGDLTNLFAEAYPQAMFVGVDLSPEQIEVAKKSASERSVSNVDWDVCDVYHLEGLKEKHAELFDIVHCRFILVHLPEPEKAVEQMLKLVKPGGRLVIEELGSSYTQVHKPSEIKAMTAWLEMVKVQHQMQKSNLHAADQVFTHLKAHNDVLNPSLTSFEISVTGSEKKCMYRMGVQIGVQKLQQLGLSHLIKSFGYDSGEEWLKEIEAFEKDDTKSLRIKGFSVIEAFKS